MKILLTDDHSIVRDGLKQILRQISDIELIAEAKTGKEALLLVSEKEFDIVVLDIALPDMSGLEVLQSIKIKRPSQSILILSMYPQEQYALRALKLGASGYLTKDTVSEELIEAVRKIAEGGKYVSSSLAANLALHLDSDYLKPLHEKLSGREFEIMLKIAKGKSLKEIGEDLFISGKTVSTYRSRVMEKMGMKKNAEVIQYCIQNGLL
jgi:two-component system, NarL family, invasion response regulator UvrY